jgi:hypothetical protein
MITKIRYNFLDFARHSGNIIYMKIKMKGFMLAILGIAGAVFVSTFDIIAGKPKNMIGPKSIIALIICVFLIAQGVILLFKKSKT